MTGHKKYELEDLLSQLPDEKYELAEEERVWEQMTPVGREFGSPDFARLMDEDAKRQETPKPDS